MAIESLHVTSYGSVREVWLKLSRVNVLVGPNDCGRTNLYRALSLLPAGTEGRFASTLAEKGDVPSGLWAGQ